MSTRFTANPGIRAELARHINLGAVGGRFFELDPGFRVDPRPTSPGGGAGTQPDPADPAASDRAAAGDTVVQIALRVQPGDLITADLINFILARLELLESRPSPTPTPTPTPTLPTITHPTITPTFNPTLNSVPTFTVATTFPTLTATLFPTNFGPTLAPTLVATLNPGFVRAVVPEDPVRVLPGIGTAEELLLRNAGIIDIRAVADADPVRITDALRVQPQEGANIVGIARGLLGRIR